MEQADCVEGTSWWHLVGACCRVAVWRLVLGLLGEAGLVQPGLLEQELVVERQVQPVLPGHGLVDEQLERVAERLELQRLVDEQQEWVAERLELQRHGWQRLNMLEQEPVDEVLGLGAE